MKNRNSIYKNLQGVSMGIMAACLALTACDKDKEFYACHARSEID